MLLGLNTLVRVHMDMAVNISAAHTMAPLDTTMAQDPVSALLEKVSLVPELAIGALEDQVTDSALKIMGLAECEAALCLCILHTALTLDLLHLVAIPGMNLANPLGMLVIAQ